MIPMACGHNAYYLAMVHYSHIYVLSVGTFSWIILAYVFLSMLFVNLHSISSSDHQAMQNKLGLWLYNDFIQANFGRTKI